MALPYYVSPELIMQDKAEYAKKGIARGRSTVAMEYEHGVVLMADNPSVSLNKISEIYDHIAFAGAGKYSEFENLRKAGIRHADMKGYLYSREDVTTKSLANAYSQSLGTIFSQEIKPLEVEILVVGLGEGETSEMYRISFDGSIFDEKLVAVIGGRSEAIMAHLKQQVEGPRPLPDALKKGLEALASVGQPELRLQQMEIAVLDRRRSGRKFRRLSQAELIDLSG
ncbi:MAG: proteasome subunit alpha [Nitrospirae bacterium RIFCSPHIGHO2_01_FULL_66_17]|jgi:proteasome alpha subunit|nr:MAG: proteasome subunit alpha [Nitrospirae bacterium RIFCSPHIGHO2_01_FULL_66_17]